MSIDMYLGDSQSQANSTQTMIQEEIRAYEELERSLTDFESSAESLKGKAYDSARNYSARVLRPLAHGGKLLSETVGKTVKQFPELYVIQVANESLKESDLEADIQKLDSLITTTKVSMLSSALVVPTLVATHQKMLNILNESRRVLQEKLQKLRDFNLSSPEIFSEIEILKNLVNTGLGQLSNGWDAKKGVYVLPTNLEWATQLMNYTPTDLSNLQPEERKYVENLMEQYGFNQETALKILKLKKGIDTKYPDKSQEERDYLLNRALGAPNYDGFSWDNTAGNLEGDSPQEFYRKMGLTDTEAKSLYYEIKKQNDFSALDPGEVVDPTADKARYAERLKLYKNNHDTSGMSDSEIEAAFLKDWKEQNKRYANKTDFAHQSITTATHLYSGWGAARIQFLNKKDLEEVAGWRGDVTKDAGANPSMGNADYKADLDAVNITNIMKEKKVSYITASNYYYNQLEEKADPNTDKMTRSELFLKSTDINHVKKEIFDMVPPKMVLAFNENIFRYVSRTEEEKRAYIKKHYPDSYNFLRSLEERDNQLGTYAERE